MTSTEQATTAAARHAQSAALRDMGTGSCPYPAGSTGSQAAARRAWYATYLQLRPPAGGIDYSSDIDFLAYGDPDQASPAPDEAITTGGLLEPPDIGGAQ